MFEDEFATTKFENGDVLVAEVQPSEFPPVRYKRRVWVRAGPRKSIASEAEEKILTENRLSNVHTFDAMFTPLSYLEVLLIKKEFLSKGFLLMEETWIAFY